MVLPLHKLKTVFKPPVICMILVILSIAFYGSLKGKLTLKTTRNIIESPMRHQNSDFQPSQVKYDCSVYGPVDYVFVKTHKTASTTVSNILHKALGERIERIAEFPLFFIGGYPGRIREEFVFKNKKAKNESFADRFGMSRHLRFNHTALTHFAPENTRFFSIIRKPWNNFQSSFYFFYHPNETFDPKGHVCFNYPFYHIAKGQRISFTEYLQRVFDSLNETVPWFFRSKNYQAYDLGLDPLLDDDVEIEKAIKTLDSQIDLMMITEYMDESVILLKDLLCLTWGEVMYTARVVNHYKPIYFSQDSTIMKKFNKFYKLDIALYEYFNRTFWKKVDAYGRQRMTNDIQQLNLLRSDIKSNVTYARGTEHQKNIDRNTSFSDLSQIIRDHKTMTQILKNKLKHHGSEIMNERLLDSLIDYMVQNNGGCPV